MDSGVKSSKRSAARRAARESRRAPKSVRPCPGPTRPSPPPETRARAACRNPPRCARSAAATGEAPRTRTARGGATRLRPRRPTRAPTSARRNSRARRFVSSLRRLRLRRRLPGAGCSQRVRAMFAPQASPRGALCPSRAPSTCPTSSWPCLAHPVRLPRRRHPCRRLHRRPRHFLLSSPRAAALPSATIAPALAAAALAATCYRPPLPPRRHRLPRHRRLPHHLPHLPRRRHCLAALASSRAMPPPRRRPRLSFRTPPSPPPPSPPLSPLGCLRCAP